jgi:hypothetical protein
MRSGFAARCMVVGLMALVFGMSAASLAIADVDTTGSLRKIPSTLKSPPGEVQPLFEKASGDYECYAYSDIQNAADSFVIGNCKAPWQIQVVSYSGPNGAGFHSYGGFVTGAFSGCGWIETRFEPKKLNSNSNSACGEGSTGDFEVPQSSFMERHNSALGDGWPVATTRACPEYANYRPWSSNNIEQELIRTAPAYASSSSGSNYPALKWRYITKYESTDGTHRYVMVRDDRYNAGEGNWVFVPRSCLPSTLPENENERLPPPPTVTTDGASGVATPNATLNATINPNGVDTQYFFEYGTTESYGSYTTTGDAGAGTSPVPVSAAIGGLAPGTAYYFRIVASSAIGEVFGGPVAFTTQPPPQVSTNGASGLSEGGATLNGTVNPEGLDSHYHFDYGPTTAYGLSTPENDAGSGTSSVPESSGITGLKPGTAYHYKIVAASSAGATESGDREFRTPGSLRWAFYNGGGSLEYSAWNGKEWEYVPLHHGISGSPSAGVDAADQLFAFYSGGTSLEQSFWNGSEWGYVPLGHAISGNPAVAVNATGDQYVFYNGGGSLEYSAWNGKEWEYVPLHHGITGSPSAAVDGANHLHVFYNGGGSLEYSAWNGKEWEYVPLHHAITGNPAVGVDPAGDEWVFYNGGGSLEESYWNGHEWGYVPLHHAIVGSPAVAVDSAGEQFVAYNGGGSLEESAWNGKEWEYVPLHHAITGSPAIVINPHTREQWIFYNGGVSLEESAWNGKEWEYVPLHHAITGNPAAIANTGNLE